MKMYYARIVMMSVTGWKQRYFYGPLATTLYLLAYEGINWKNFLKACHTNRRMINFIGALVFVIYISYWMGSAKNQNKIQYMQFAIQNTLGMLDESERNKEMAELKLNDLFNSRSYKEFLIHKEAKILVPSTVPDEDLDLMCEAADEFNIPYFIFFRLIQKESSFTWLKNGKIITSSAGAQGYTQLMPTTFSSYCEKMDIEDNIMTPKNNLRIGAKLLSDLYQMYNAAGDRTNYETWKKPLMAYNAGCGNVASGKADSFSETKNYVAVILKP
jgi:soluble lytic murein transglycosylase-like protein